MKTKRTRTVALLVALVLCLGVTAIFPMTASARFNTLIGCDNSLTLNSGGRLGCYGGTEVQYGYKADVKVELQQYNGGWRTIKTWTSPISSSYASVYSDWYVNSGYQYRLQVTHRALNSSNSVVETFVSYSRTVFY